MRDEQDPQCLTNSVYVTGDDGKAGVANHCQKAHVRDTTAANEEFTEMRENHIVWHSGTCPPRYNVVGATRTLPSGTVFATRGIATRPPEQQREVDANDAKYFTLGAMQAAPRGTTRDGPLTPPRHHGSHPRVHTRAVSQSRPASRAS